MRELENLEQQSSILGGLFRKSENPIDVSKATVEDFIELGKKAEEEGLDYEYNGDGNTVTPKRIVVVPEKKK